MTPNGSLMKKILFLVLAPLPLCALAEPTGAPYKIISIRPYQTTVFVQVATTNLCGTNMFRLDLTQPGGSALYSAALAAATAGKNVALEVSGSAGCSGWGTLLLSMIVIM
jgi:hypothetical protein